MKVVRGLGLALLILLVGCPSEQEGYLENTNQGAGFTGNVNPDGAFGGTTFNPPTVNLEAPTAPVSEGSTMTLTVRLSNRHSEDVSIPFTVTTENTAVTATATPETAGINDIAMLTASPIVVPAGSTFGTITITVVDDPFQEEPPLETFKVTLGTPSSGSVGANGSATLTINDTDDDGLGSSISGRVTNAQTGTGIAAVTVSGGGRTAQTDALGFYELTAPTPAASIVVSFTKDGFVPQSRTTGAVTTSLSAAVINVPMLAESPGDSFDPTTAHVTTVPGTAATVSFGAGTLETTAGGAPSGNAIAFVTPIAAANDVNLLPGMYRAPAPVETFGGLAIRVEDTAGNELRLISGQSATISIPAATRGTAMPATLTLFSFDAASGLWNGQGNATLTGFAPAETYDGSIGALGIWAANVAYGPATVTGCVVDPTGSRVAEATVVAEGTDYVGTSSTVTDAQGVFTLQVRQGSGAFVQANFRTGLSNARTSSGGTMSSCLLVIAGAASIKLTWGDSPSDLDSHTLGPNSNSHTYWIGKGSLTSLPFVGLDVDDVTGYGPEVTTIVKAAKSRKYRFLVRNYSQSYAPGQTDSPAKVELFVKGRQYIFTPPPGEVTTSPGTTAVWHVFDLTTDAACEITTIAAPTANQWRDLTDSAIGTTMNPNTDSAAAFCN